MRRHPLAQMFLIGLVASVVGVAAVLLLDWFPPQASTTASDVDTLYDVLLIVSVPIFVLVMTVAIYSVVKFRARPGDKGDGAPIHGNTLLEVVWVTIPFLLVSALAVYGWVVLDDQEEPQPNAMIVNVTGQQFSWSFQYPGEAGAAPVTSNELILPVGQPVDFKIQALDVIHSFWVPAFRLKSDAVPGIETEFRVTPSAEGNYDVVCAELCGLGHSTMRQTVRIVPPEEFETWISEEQAAAEEEQSQESGAPPGEDATTPPAGESEPAPSEAGA